MMVRWLGYDFHVYDPYDPTLQWYDRPGVYILSGFNYLLNLWVPLYIGQAQSFRYRIPYHERWYEAALRGATHIHAIVIPRAEDRTAVERQLIEACQPPLNVRHRSLADFFSPLLAPELLLSR